MIEAALDTSLGGALVLRRQGILTPVFHLPGSGRDSDRVLTPWLRDTLHDCGETLQSVQRWSVGTGPGSFAGLRCGLALAKAICLASGAAIRGVPSAYALAAQARRHPGQTVGVLHDGRCGQILLCRYAPAADDTLHPAATPAPFFPDALIAAEISCDVWLTLQAVQLPPLPEEVRDRLQQVTALNPTPLLDAPLWPWPADSAARELSCEPVYVRQAVFVKPAVLRD